MGTETNVHFISHDSLLAERQKATVEEEVEYRIDGELKTVKKSIVNGELETFDFDEDSPIGELLTSPAGLDSLIQKSVIDIEQGREAVPLLYGPIYRRRENRRFTKTVQVNTSSAARTRAVFLEHLEGEEVRFATRTIGALESVPILTYAAGVQWTEDMEEFDLTWEAEEANRALGEAHNALLNHIHLYPIISYSYTGDNLQTYNPNTLTGTQYEKDRDTLIAALRKASLNENPNTGRGQTPTIVLAHSSNRFRIEEMLQRRQIGGTIYEAIGQQINTVILYDGYSIQIGERTYSYAGVGTSYILLIEPQAWFHELVKHDLRVDAGNADLSRLISEQIVARSRRGVYAAPANAVTKMNLA